MHGVEPSKTTVRKITTKVAVVVILEAGAGLGKVLHEDETYERLLWCINTINKGLIKEGKVSVKFVYHFCSFLKKPLLPCHKLLVGY